MVFYSSLFLLYFFPIFLVIYYLIKDTYKNVTIVLASIFFYMWGAPKFIFLLLISIIVVFYIARLIHRSQGKKKKIVFVLSIILNLGILVYFKYANFFLENFNILFNNLGIHSVSLLKIVIPLGISFYTFHEISYLIDVYRNKRAPLKKLLDFSMYILFFTKLFAGPIVRYHEIGDQIESKEKFDTIDNRLIGFIRFCIGLAKKVLIANVLGIEADRIFSYDPTILSTTEVWIGILAYAFQIYYDFSGYSDMAIGIARMLGFVFPENFNSPYISGSITEFWKRWHISLSMWFREYLFLPLAYKLSKKLPKNRYFKIKTDYLLYIYAAIITFTLCGFWHGAAWSFIIWGLYHGFFISMERLFLNKFYKKIGKYPSVIITFIILLVSWVFFRSETLPYAFLYLKTMFSFNFTAQILTFSSEFWVIFIIASFFSFICLSKPGKYLNEKIFSDKYSMGQILLMSFLSIIIYFLVICNVTALGFNPFIYLRF
jgi:alginate O-acetyltransferase complex protein AlgI